MKFKNDLKTSKFLTFQAFQRYPYQLSKQNVRAKISDSDFHAATFMYSKIT